MRIKYPIFHTRQKSDQTRDSETRVIEIIVHLLFKSCYQLVKRVRKVIKGSLDFILFENCLLKCPIFHTAMQQSEQAAHAKIGIQQGQQMQQIMQSPKNPAKIETITRIIPTAVI